ncbi:Lrp/AsnC family transcriptional regulator [Streptomyces sp. BI20]|uniref:Lrp/AsnC family transcriptional regulator n=1 Tax=Streptomyces sp. BI20 TaxID=3403460 RepID=UPI003C78A739
MNASISAIDDTDRALVHALQLAPRASWERLAGVLGSRPDTLARRWERLTACGAAWSFAVGLRSGRRPPCLAWVEVRCGAGAADGVGAALAADPHALGVEHCTGDRDLLLFVAVPDPAALYRWLSERVCRLPGVVDTRSAIVTTVHQPPDRWRLDQLTPAQAARLPASVSPGGVGRVAELTPADRPLVLALAGDARRSVAALARECAMSESTVRRRLAVLEAGRGLRLGCGVSAGLSGWPVTATVWASVPEHEVVECAAVVGGLRETVACASVTGPRNLLVSVRLRSVEELSRYCGELTRRLPGVRVADSSVSLRVRKVEGQVLDARGYRVGTVAPDIWADPGGSG